MGRAIGIWRLQWVIGSGPELMIVNADGAPVLVDTRRIASAARTPLPPAWDDALHLLERPRAPGDVDVEPSVIAALIERRYVILHEGLLLSVVTREAGTVADMPAYAKASAA